jgi:BirA family transcriptional regulator, biotin operon repressor / biotin---[acetyl-CoA-carboxylase] ligase
MISQSQIRRGLGTSVFGEKVFTFETLDSTNNCVKALANAGLEEGLIVYSEYQSAGRGRLGRTWESEKGRNVLFSLLLRPAETVALINLLTFYVAVSISDAVTSVTGERVECKWPNDLTLDGKKFCGILLEASSQQTSTEFVIAGIGINVNQTGFGEDLEGKVTSVRRHSGKEIDRLALLQECIRSLEKHYLKLQSDGFDNILGAWKSRCSMFNKTIRADHHGTVISGVVQRLDPDGALVVRSHDKEIRLLAGDVTVLETL